LTQTLISLAREFEELADTCLLVLHLEVRVHCFHYLHPIWKGPAGAQFAGGQDSTDPNPEVVKLTKDLIQVDYVIKLSVYFSYCYLIGDSQFVLGQNFTIGFRYWYIPITLRTSRPCYLNKGGLVIRTVLSARVGLVICTRGSRYPYF